MSNKKQTAIEWLIEELLIYGDKAFNKEISLGEYHIKKNELINQAKEMEKQQIMDAYHINPLESKWENIGEQYYKETYEDRD